MAGEVSFIDSNGSQSLTAIDPTLPDPNVSTDKNQNIRRLHTLDVTIGADTYHALVIHDANASAGASEQHEDGETITAGDKGTVALGSDGTDYQFLTTDTDGHLQVDVLTLPTPVPVTDNGGSITIDTASGAIQIEGDVAHDTTDSGNPLKIGGKAIGTHPKTAVAANERVEAYFELEGRQIIADYFAGDPAVDADERINAGFEDFGSVTAGASERLIILSIHGANTSSTGIVLSLRDGSAGITLKFPLAPDYGGFTHTFKRGWPLSTGSELQWNVSTAVSTVYVNIEYLKIAV